MISAHLQAIHSFYGDLLGVRLARKHIKWYLEHWDSTICNERRQQINAAEEPATQLALVDAFLFNSVAELAA